MVKKKIQQLIRNAKKEGVYKMNASEIYSMFEEIKKENAAIIKELSKPEPTVVSNYSKEYDSKIEQLLVQVQTQIQKNNKEHRTDEQAKFDQTYQTLLSIDEHVKAIKRQQTLDKVIPLKNIFFVIAMAVVVLVISILYVGQLNYNRQLKDNDLKYRNILMQGGIDANALYQLENSFGINRNKKQIKQIRNQVEAYEQAVIRQAEKMERARRKEEQAKELQDEAKQLKNSQ